MSSKFFKFFRYVASGGTGAFTNLFFLFVFVHYGHMWYLVSAIIAFILAQIVSFVMQKFWTFNDHTKDIVHRQALSYLSLGAVNLAVNTALVYVFVEWQHMAYLGAQIVSSILIAFYSYFVYSQIFKITATSRDTISS